MAIISNVRIKNIHKRDKEFMEKLGNGKNIKEDLEKYINRVAHSEEEIRKLSVYYKELNKKQEKCLVSEAETTSNCTIKEWFKIIEEWDGTGKLDVKSIISLEKKKKTLKNKHIEYQTYEEKLCGRSLEEAIKNSNRELYNLGKTPKESDLDFNSSDNKKTEFALDLLMKDDYNIPQYIRNGLEWLSSKNPYVDGEETDE